MCADYDNSAIAVDPNNLKTMSDVLNAESQGISDSLALINKTLSGLRLEWRGKAASEREEISSEWTRVCGELFGPKDKPDTGVLSALARHVTMAARNHAVGEQAAIGVFDKMLAGIAQQDADEAYAENMSKGAPDPDKKFQEVMQQLQATHEFIDALSGHGEEAAGGTNHTDPSKTAIFTE